MAYRTGKTRPGTEQQEKKQFEERVISLDRVARVVKGGRRFRFRALVAIGDGKGKVGVGVAKATDIQAAVAKAVEKAKRDLVEVPLYKSTIPHVVEVKRGGAHVLLKPAAGGTGVIAGGVVRTVIDVSGIQDVLSKSLGSGNKINTAYATIDALRSLKPASEWVTMKSKPKAQKSEKKTPQTVKKTANKKTKSSTAKTKSKETK